MRQWIVALVLVAVLSNFALAQENKEPTIAEQLFGNADIHGFWEVRSGYRIRKDPYQKDM